MATVSILKKQRTISRRLFSLSYNSCLEKLSKGEIHEIRVIFTILNEKANQMFDIEEEFKNAIFNLDLSEEETLKELDLESFCQRETEYILLKAQCEKLLCSEPHEVREFADANLLSNYKTLDDTQTTGNYKEDDSFLTEGLHDDIIDQVGDDNGYFLSQHSVIEEASLTTRMRPVFDCSARDEYGKYFNASLEPSINLLEMITKLLRDCRIREYGLRAHIKRGFWQISLADSDLKYLKFLWRANEDPHLLIASPDSPWWGGWCKQLFRMLKEILRRLLEKLGSGLKMHFCHDLCALGAVFRYSYACGGPAHAYCARPGLRLWRADKQGEVLQTLLFKEAITNPLTIAELLNPSQRKHSHSDQEYNFGPLFVFREHFIVSHNEHILYILDPRSLTAVAVVDDLRRILSVSVNKEEIFVLEGPRSLVRLAHAPEPAALATEEPISLMTKSLTSSIQQAVNTVRDLTHIDQTVPYITSVLEQPISMFTRQEDVTIGSAEECFELPPIKTLPIDLSENVLESIVNEFRDVTSDVEEFRRAKSEELQRKLKLYNSIMERKCDEELIHSSRRSKRRDGSGASTPRMATPVRKPENISFTSPCVMDVSTYGNSLQENDENLEKEIEEKEKILAKMLNLESLSIKSPKIDYETEVSPRLTEMKPNIVDTSLKKEFPVYKHIDVQRDDEPKVVNSFVKDTNPLDLVPKVVKLPNNWNLENIELKFDTKNSINDHVISPDDHLDSEWEFI